MHCGQVVLMAVLTLVTFAAGVETTLCVLATQWGMAALAGAAVGTGLAGGYVALTMDEPDREVIVGGRAALVPHPHHGCAVDVTSETQQRP